MVNSVSVAESDVGWIVAFRSAKVVRIPRYFRGAKGDKGLSATETNSYHLIPRFRDFAPSRFRGYPDYDAKVSTPQPQSLTNGINNFDDLANWPTGCWGPRDLARGGAGRAPRGGRGAARPSGRGLSRPLSLVRQSGGPELPDQCQERAVLRGLRLLFAVAGVEGRRSPHYPLVTAERCSTVPASGPAPVEDLLRRHLGPFANRSASSIRSPRRCRRSRPITG